MKIMMMAGGMKGRREECPHGDIGGFESRRGRSEVIHMSDASRTSGNIKVAGSGEPATQDEENARMEMVKRKLEKYGYDAEGMTEEQRISIFNAILAEEGKEYWLCPKCLRFHPKHWTKCDLPCVQYEASRMITEEEIEEINFMFDPVDYEQDPYFLRFPHTRLQRWMDEAEDTYNILASNLMNLKLARACELWNIDEIVINDTSCEHTLFENALRRFEIQMYRGVETDFRDLDELLDFFIEHAPKPEMSQEERQRLFDEIQAIMREKAHRPKAWRDTTPSYRLLHPGNCTLVPRIRTITVNNNGNEKIIERVEYVRA